MFKAIYTVLNAWFPSAGDITAAFSAGQRPTTSDVVITVDVSGKTQATFENEAHMINYDTDAHSNKEV